MAKTNQSPQSPELAFAAARAAALLPATMTGVSAPNAAGTVIDFPISPPLGGPKYYVQMTLKDVGVELTSRCPQVFADAPCWADDLKTGEKFMMDSDSDGFAAIKDRPAGTTFLGDITTTHYITKIRLPENTPGN